MPDLNDADVRASTTRKFRKRFIIKAYLVFGLSVLITIVQWVLIMMSEYFSIFLITHVELCVVSFFVALILMTVFVFVETVRIALPLNWFLAFFILQSIILGLSRILVVSCFEVLGLCLALVIVPLIIFILIGSFVRHDFTLDVIILFVLSFIFFVGAVYFVTLYVVGGAFFSYMIFTVMVYVIVCVFAMYHAQTINGGRYAEMRLTDYLLAALILYVDFIILYMVTTYAMNLAWSEWQQKECNKYQNHVNATNYARMPSWTTTTPKTKTTPTPTSKSNNSTSQPPPQNSQNSTGFF